MERRYSNSSRRYLVEDLLKVRESPLVAPPTSLRPPEEWMGNQEHTARRTSAVRSKPDDALLNGEHFPKRPNLVDRKSATASSDISLAPPLRSFRSSRKVATQDEFDDATTSNVEASKSIDDAESRVGVRRLVRPEGVSNRFTSRSEKTDLANGKFRRREEEEDLHDGERPRPRWRGREGRSDIGEQEVPEENGRSNRREGQGRSRFDQPWIRGERATEATTEHRRPENRQSDWRRNREWGPAERAEPDPEWMDAAPMDEPAQEHTMEEFELWKQRMKTGGAVPDSNAHELPTATFIEERKPSIGPAAGIKSPEPDDAMDKFFAKFSQQQAQEEVNSATKPAGKTRFASLWNKPAESESAAVVARPEEKPISTTPSTTDADQAGFARILQMLGSRGTATTPQDLPPQQAKTPVYTQAHPEAQGRMKSPELATTSAANGEEAPRTRTSRNLDRYLGSKPSETAHVRQESTKDTSELLLNLMRQANINQQAQQIQPPSDTVPRHPPGLFPTSEPVNRVAANHNNLASATPFREFQLPEQGGASSFFHGPLSTRMQYQDDASLQDYPQNGPHRRPTDGSQQTFFDEAFANHLRQQPQNKGPPNPASMLALPVGLPRPPGLDNVQRIPPPGWSNQPSRQPAGPPRQTLPPGVSHISQSMQDQFGSGIRHMPPPPGIPQHLQQPPQPPNMQRPQRKYTGESGPAFPTGMAPPPGFMTSGPPPGFSGAPQNYARYPIGNEQQSLGRGFAELYGDRRGGQMPGGYR